MNIDDNLKAFLKTELKNLLKNNKFSKILNRGKIQIKTTKLSLKINKIKNSLKKYNKLKNPLNQSMNDTLKCND